MKKGTWTREEYGSAWLFRARSDRSSPHLPTNSAPGTRGERKKRRFLFKVVGGYIEAGQGILRDVLISYLPENRSGGARLSRVLSRCLSIWLRVTSNDEGKRERLKCKIYVACWNIDGEVIAATNFPPIRRIISFFSFFLKRADTCFARNFISKCYEEHAELRGFLIFQLVRKCKKLLNFVLS